MTRKLTLATFLLVLHSSNAFSQTNDSTSNSMLHFEIGLASPKDVSFGKDHNDSRRIYGPMFGLSYSQTVSGIHGFSTGILYYPVGDVYEYFTGINSEVTDVKIFVNTIKIPLLYKIESDQREPGSIFLRGGPSFDFVIGKPVIWPKDELNSPDGFRRNVTQGKVEKNLFILLNASLGYSFRNQRGGRNYVEFVYYGTVKNIFPESEFGNGESSYQSMALKLGFSVDKKK